MSELKKYIPLVRFMGQVFGSDFEIVLHDVRYPDASVIAVENGHITGRTLGGQMTASERQIILEEKYLESDFLTGFGRQTENGHYLVHSAYFIKEDHECIGLLSVSHNADTLLEAQHAVNALISAFSLPEKTLAAYSEKTGGSMLDISGSRILNTLNSLNVTPQHMSAAEKMDIVRRLDQQDIFSTKGAVAQAAEYLNVSEPTLYRYLSKIRKEKGSPSSL